MKTFEYILYIILGIVITFLINYIYPYIKFKNNKYKYTKKQINKILIINAIVIFIADCIIQIIFTNDLKINISPLIYYWINKKIFINNKNINHEKNVFFCSYCGKQLHKDDIYCTNCGKSKYKKRKKENDIKIKKFNNYVSEANYSISYIFKKNSIKYYDLALITTNIAILSVFYLYKNGNKDKEINDYIKKFINELEKNSTLTNIEIEEIKSYIEILNETISDLIISGETKKLIDKITKNIIKICTNENYYKFSKLSIIIAQTYTNIIEDIIN